MGVGKSEGVGVADSCQNDVRERMRGAGLVRRVNSVHMLPQEPGG